MNELLGRLSFLLALVPVLIGPWLFGAWEVWWFWPCACFLFISTGLFACRILNVSALAKDAGWTHVESITPVALAYLPFLGYALARLAQAEVHVTAERSFLLFLTPFLLAFSLAVGGSSAQLRRLFSLIWLNLVLIAVYAIVNHQITAGRYVLWREGFRTYYKDGRTTGCYFCPDHFSGAMEILLGIALGVLGARRTGVRGRLAAVLSMILALYGILLSQSRGGALTVIVVVIAFLAIGLCEYRPRTRWLVRAGLAAAVAGAICVAVIAEVAVVKRMRAYPWDRIERDSRYQMAAAALRAWSETPATRVFGIGPGMHQNLWLHYAASNDGDRATGTWPRFRNMRAYSYEVHNDWLQLLEEYGVTGFLLFCVSVGGFVMLLMRGYLSQSRERRRADWSDGGGSDFQFMLASLLAIVAIGFHSLGDFNLQIPGTNWMFAALLSVSAGLVIRSR